MNKPSPFDVANCINEKTGELNADEIGYDSYMMNRIFSNTKDTVLFANELNIRWNNLTKQQQFDFYYHGIPKKKRYGKWHKNQDDRATLDLIQEAFNMSRRKAKDVVELIRPKMEELQQELNKGGRNGMDRKRPGGHD